jgi:DNA-binding CsgD family transcriptional regulator
MRADYKLPLPVLRGYLGPSTLTEFESPKEAGAFHRAWRCGCTAQYRKSIHQTAVWRPCLTHRANPGQPAGASAPAERTNTGDGHGRRHDPAFCIIDPELNVLCKSAGSEAEHLVQKARDRVEAVVAGGEAAVIEVDAETLLRILPLKGDPANAFAVVVEGRRGLSRLVDAATRYRLTRRETEVLRLILANQTNGEIARELCIAETTVSDHLKSLFRKTGCKRRTELLTKLFLT